MSQQEEPLSAGEDNDANSGTIKPGSEMSAGSRSINSTREQVLRQVPSFEPITTGDARARAAVDQWRTFTMLLEPQPGSAEVATVFEQLTKLASMEHEGGESKTRFTVVTKESLSETAKQNGMSGERMLAQAMVWTLARDREEGLVAKKNKALEVKRKKIRGEGDNDLYDSGDQETEAPGMARGFQKVDKIEQRVGNMDNRNVTGQEGQTGGEKLKTITWKQTERERAKAELRAAQLFTTIEDDLGAPDRVYILKGFPGTEAEAAHFLEENNAYYAVPSRNKKKTEQPKPMDTGDKPPFLSALDAVVQLTTRELVNMPVETPPGKVWPGTALGSASARDQHTADLGDDDDTIAPRKTKTTWDRLRNTSSSSPFTQASGATKALAVAQAKGGTVWQDLSFSYINVIAPEDPNNTSKRPTVSKGKSDKNTGKGTAKQIGETKDILELAREFKEMVIQIAFEKFDFHQWFSTAEVVTIPRRDKGIDLTRAVSEAQAATRGTLSGSNRGGGSAARFKGSLWATDPTLLTYSDLMLAVPDELTSVATALYGMVEAVMVGSTGTIPCPLDSSQPASLAANSSNACLASLLVGNSAVSAPISDDCLGSKFRGKNHSVPLGENSVSEMSESGASKNGGADNTSLAPTELPVHPIPRNAILEFGDFIGERAIRGALNRAASFGEGRVDPRAVVAIERKAIAKLRNPRLVGQGGLPREPGRSEKDRGTEQCELLTFTNLDQKDVNRTRQVWALARLINTHHPPAGKGEAWSFVNRRYWDVLSQHVVQQVLSAENGMQPLCLRQYYPPTDELLVALYHETPIGRVQICSWDPCASGSIPFNFKPSFKDWANMAPARDSSYTPRTVSALGAIMGISKPDLDRAKIKSVKVFPADHSLVVLSGFVKTGKRWLSAFKDGHVMGLKLTESDQGPSRGETPDSAKRESHVIDSKGTRARHPQFAARFTMAFDDESRIVVKEGFSTPPWTPSRPTSSGGKGGNSNPQATPALKAFNRGRRGGKPDGFGTVSCVHTFPTGLVVTTNSDGTVGMEFVLDSKHSGSGKMLGGFVPEPAKDELSRMVVERGTVVRYMRDGSTQILFVTGDVVTRKGGETTLTDKHGRSFRKAEKLSSADDTPTAGTSKTGKPSEMATLSDVFKASSSEWVPVKLPPPVPTTTAGKTSNKKTKNDLNDQRANALRTSKSSTDRNPVKDVETGALVWCPPGGSGKIVSIFEDGVTVTRHADGTVQRWRRGEGEGSAALGMVLVECAGFVSIEVDIEIQEMCFKHAKGNPVTIARGGNRIRLRAVMPNGGATLVTYDTRVTSKVCGRIVYVHSDNTEVIANDKGEVIVRPRGMWEGRPMHGIIAGPNSSMPPNCAQPDLLVGAYTFDCLKGVMESEDIDRNRFELDVTKTAFLKDSFAISRAGGPTAGSTDKGIACKEKDGKGKRTSARPSSMKSQSQCNGVTIELAGETLGVNSEALVNNHLEPRLFVYQRDGSALELLRNEDAQKWCESLSLSPSAPPQERFKGKARTGVWAPNVVDMRRYECCTDPHSQGTRQLCFYEPLTPVPRGEGSFAVMLRRRPGEIFGDGYHGDNGESFGASSWRTRPLPLAARATLEREAGIPGCGSTIAMEACIRRVWLEHPPLSVEASKELGQALLEWGSWKRARAKQIDRFSVSDPRPTSEVEAQQSVQKLIRKAFREAKVARQKQKEKAKAAQAQAEKQQQKTRTTAMSGSQSRTVEAATTLSASFGDFPTVGTTVLGEVGSANTKKHDDEDEDEVEFPDSEEEEEETEELTLLRQESTSAFASAGGNSKGYLNISALRVAMIMVLGRAVKESEAESLLLAIEKRSFPGQHKASLRDFFHLLLGAQESQPETLAHVPVVTTSPSVSVEGCTGRTPKNENYQPFLKDNNGSPTTTTSRLKPPVTPRSFWDTPVGRSLDGSAVEWTERILGGITQEEEISDPPKSAFYMEGVQGSPPSDTEVGGEIAHAQTGVFSSVVSVGGGEPGNGKGELLTDGNAGAMDKPEGKQEELSQKRSDSQATGVVMPTQPTEPSSQESIHTPSESINTGSALADGYLDSSEQVRACSVGDCKQNNLAGKLPIAGYSVQVSRDVVGEDIGKGRVDVEERGRGTLAQGTGTKAVKSLSQGRGVEASMNEKVDFFFESKEAPRGKNVVAAGVFEVTPASVSLGSIEVGRKLYLKIFLCNVGDKPARFRVEHQHGQNKTGCARVIGYPRGSVAAGLTVAVSLEVVANRRGMVQDFIRIVTEDGCAEVNIKGETFEAVEIPETVTTQALAAS